MIARDKERCTACKNTHTRICCFGNTPRSSHYMPPPASTHVSHVTKTCIITSLRVHTIKHKRTSWIVSSLMNMQHMLYERISFPKYHLIRGGMCVNRVRVCAVLAWECSWLLNVSLFSKKEAKLVYNCYFHYFLRGCLEFQGSCFVHSEDKCYVKNIFTFSIMFLRLPIFQASIRMS